MGEQRVVITGLGVVSSIGFGASEFHQALRSGVCGTSPITSFDASGFPNKMGGEVRGFVPTRWLRRLDPARHARASQFAAAAARMAADDAGVDPAASATCGASIGTTDGNNDLIELLTEQWLAAGPESMTPERTRQIPASRIANAVSAELGLRGESITLSTACSAGNYAIGHAYDLVHDGEVEYMLCGGADGAVPRWVHAGFHRLGATSPDVCRPFDKHRQGILVGEGAGVLFIESLASARRRGARIYAELLGYGLNCDATHITAPNHVTIAECIRLAHQSAGITPEDVDYICAHGTGTKLNDATETMALKEVFGARVPPTSSIKSMIGHTMGAASALGAVAGALAIHEGFLPPTIHFQERDPDCDIDCVPNHARAAKVDVVQNNGFAFGGNNAITILGSEKWANRHCR